MLCSILIFLGKENAGKLCVKLPNKKNNAIQNKTPTGQLFQAQDLCFTHSVCKKCLPGTSFLIISKAEVVSSS